MVALPFSISIAAKLLVAPIQFEMRNLPLADHNVMPMTA
jgi:hypothetical protein